MEVECPHPCPVSMEVECHHPCLVLMEVEYPHLNSQNSLNLRDHHSLVPCHI